VLAVFNDEVVVPALLRLGIPIEDARDYCNDGCSEIILGGKGTIQFRVHDSLPLLTETVMEARERSFESFDQVMDDFKSRLDFYMPPDSGSNPPVTFPYFAASIDDCMEKGSASGARYPITGSILAQVGDTADGLAAIQQLIYHEGVLTWEDLASALDADFEGHEPLRQMIRNRGPKYGNDDDRVDDIARDVAETFCDGVHERAQNVPGHGNKRAPGLMCFGIQRKKDLPASPDGRRQGDLTANSFSPAVGMDRSGPTAVLKSVGKVDLSKASHGSVLDLALHSSFVAGEEAFGKFVALLESFLTMRCTATLQPNIIDRETLLRARENPTSPEFRTLIVRVWGFSAVFVELPEALQDHVLSRTEHGMA
jgi:formate C-acetyltransferase